MTENKELLEKVNRIEEMLFMTKRVFTIQEAAKFTNLTERTIYKKTSLGEIPHSKQAGKLFFDRLLLEEWLLENKGYSKSNISSKASTYNLNSRLKGGDQW